jgi:hypothetical protein
LIRAGDDPTGAGATAFATLVLCVDEGHLSIFNRTPPKLPASKRRSPPKEG